MFLLFKRYTLLLPSKTKIGNRNGLWCNGSTTDFDSVCLGSNPSNPTQMDKPQITGLSIFILWHPGHVIFRKALFHFKTGHLCIS